MLDVPCSFDWETRVGAGTSESSPVSFRMNKEDSLVNTALLGVVTGSPAGNTALPIEEELDGTTAVKLRRGVVYAGDGKSRDGAVDAKGFDEKGSCSSEIGWSFAVEEACVKPGSFQAIGSLTARSGLKLLVSLPETILQGKEAERSLSPSPTAEGCRELDPA